MRRVILIARSRSLFSSSLFFLLVDFVPFAPSHHVLVTVHAECLCARARVYTESAYQARYIINHVRKILQANNNKSEHRCASAPSWLQRQTKKNKIKRRTENPQEVSLSLCFFYIFRRNKSDPHGGALRRRWRWRRQRFTQLSRLRMYRKRTKTIEKKYTNRDRPPYLYTCVCV